MKLHQACWEWVFRTQSLFTRERWSVFTARLLLKEKSLRCCNWNTQTVGWASPPEVLLQLWYPDLAEGFEGRKPARKNRSRKQGRSEIKGSGTDRRSLHDEAPMDLLLSLPRVQELSPPSRHLNGKQWAWILCACQEWPSRAREGGKRERAVICCFSCWF